MKILTRAFNKDPPEILRRIVVKEFLVRLSFSSILILIKIYTL